MPASPQLQLCKYTAGQALSVGFMSCHSNHQLQNRNMPSGSVAFAICPVGKGNRERPFQVSAVIGLAVAQHHLITCTRLCNLKHTCLFLQLHVLPEGASEPAALLGCIRLIHWLAQPHVLGLDPLTLVVDCGTGTTATGEGCFPHVPSVYWFSTM